MPLRFQINKRQARATIATLRRKMRILKLREARLVNAASASCEKEKRMFKTRRRNVAAFLWRHCA